jgi:hypothetical protein
MKNNDMVRFSEGKEYGPFYDVFDDAYDNRSSYYGTVDKPECAEKGICRAFKQLEQGYSIILFGYGLSGSGKTFSLLGGGPTYKPNPSDPTGNNKIGLLHYGLKDLVDVKTIAIAGMYELYPLKVAADGSKLIINDQSFITLDYSRMKSETKIDPGIVMDDIDIDNDIHKLTDLITIYRTNEERIKSTPNNPESSRSHLFLVFRITFGSGKIGYLTLIDTAGREDPISILKNYIDPSEKGKLQDDVVLNKINQRIQSLLISLESSLTANIIIKNYERNKLSAIKSLNKQLDEIMSENKLLDNKINDQKKLRERSPGDVAKIAQNEEIINQQKQKIDALLFKLYSQPMDDDLVNYISNLRQIYNSYLPDKLLTLNEDLRNVVRCYNFKYNTEASAFVFGYKKLKNAELIQQYIATRYKIKICILLKEGIYINETINHLIYRLNKNINPNHQVNVVQTFNTSPAGAYSTDRYYTDPKAGQLKLLLDKIEGFNTAVKSENKPTKYVALVCVRKEQKYLDDTKKSLLFASSIKST